MSKKPRALGAYVYAGGFGIGVKQGGFELAGHLEDPKPYGEEVLRMNDKYYGDVDIVPYPWYEETQDELHVDPCMQNIDFIYANPPCAPFSQNNQNSHRKENWKLDKRVECIHNVMSLLDVVEPHVLAFESVSHIYSKAGPFLEQLAEYAHERGYQVTFFIHNTMYHGSHQSRKRFFFIASKTDFKLAPYDSDPRKCVMDAVNDAAAYHGSEDNHFKFNLAKKHRHLFKDVEPGKSLRTAWEKNNPEETWEYKENGHVKGRPSYAGHRRPKKDMVTSAIVGYPMLHPTEDRELTSEEYCRIADFPCDYNFPAARSTLGYAARGVSPVMGEWLAKSVILTMRANEEVEELYDVRVIQGHFGKDRETTEVFNLNPETQEEETDHDELIHSQ
tara:strand:+ start:694 stop:1860 length:1167 start_codon:yes stop_codon:yes gene_type:complete